MFRAFRGIILQVTLVDYPRFVSLTLLLSLILCFIFKPTTRVLILEPLIDVQCIIDMAYCYSLESAAESPSHGRRTRRTFKANDINKSLPSC